jgi:hypothetical protein
MVTLLALVVASAVPEGSAKPSLAVTADLTYAAGISPGNVVGGAVGARFSFGHVSFGVEAQVLPPGYHVVVDRDVIVNELRWRTPPAIWGSQGIGGVVQPPICFRFGPMSGCGVGTVGAVSLRGYGSPEAGQWHPTVSGGVRLAGEFPSDSKLRLRASAQVLGGFVRPTDGFWEASPIQLGLTLGIVFDAV